MIPPTLLRLAAVAVSLLLTPLVLHGGEGTVSEWQRRAVQAYPPLGEKGSEFNKRFLQRYEEKKASEPNFLANLDWPYTLATEVAQSLGMKPIAPPAPSPLPLPPTPLLPPPAEPPPSPTPATVEPANDQSSEWEADKTPDELGLEFAKFRWWAPGGVPLRGVLVLAPGRGGDGRGMADDVKWQKIAREQHFGIVACFLKNRSDTPFAYQQDPKGGTSTLVNRAIERLLMENGHSGTRNLPLFFYGHSAGANVAQRYGNLFAQRMIGAVIMRCPSGPGDYASAKGDVPMLIYIGGKDKREWVDYSLERYQEGQGKRAVWTLAMHPEEGHGTGNTWELTESYIKDVVTQRLGKPGPGSSTMPKKLSRQQAWLGDPETFAIAPASQFKGNKQKATWLPDEATAKLWQTYLGK